MTSREHPYHPRNLGPRPDPRGFFEGCKTVTGPRGETIVVYCDTCRQPVRVWFGVDRCGCTPEHSHLDEMLRKVGR